MSSKISYRNQGLTQETLVNYNIEQHNKRSHSSEKSIFTRTVTLHLPLFLTIPVWKRHSYTLEDIHCTLEFFSSVHLWQCALLFGISASGSAIKLAFSTPESMVYGSKAIVIRKIEKIIQNQYDFPKKGSVLDTVRDDHIPPLPLHRLDTVTFENLMSYLPQKPVCMLETILIQDYVTWKDIMIVPLWIEKEAVYCIRIVLQTVFSGSDRMQNTCLSTRPLQIQIGDTLYAGLEEAMFFVSE